jgi:hypothetical protein
MEKMIENLKAAKMIVFGLIEEEADPASMAYDLLKEAIEDLEPRRETHRRETVRLEEAVDDLCDLLEEEWGNGDGMPEKATEKYRRACRAIGRSPVYGGIG